MSSRYWTRKPRSGLSVLLAYILIEGLLILTDIGAIFWRVSWLGKPTSRVEIVLITLTCISIVIALVGLILGLLLRREIEKQAFFGLKKSSQLLSIQVDGGDQEPVQQTSSKGEYGHRGSSEQAPSAVTTRFISAKKITKSPARVPVVREDPYSNDKSGVYITARLQAPTR